MNRPRVICHMLMSIDGKVTGDFLFTSECADATNEYYKINREFNAQAYACGRVTMEGSFTGAWYPDLEEFEPCRDISSDFVFDTETGFYAVAFDRHGKLGWKASVIEDEDPGYGGAHIIEVLSENTDPRYLTYLRQIGVSYIFAGKDDIDVSLALSKLYRLFKIETLLLEGGSIINGAFQKAGVVDELSLVMVPTVAGDDSKPLFYESNIENYRLVSAGTQSGVLLLRYVRI